MANEKRLIDADALGSFSFNIESVEDDEVFERLVVLCEDIETAPTIDAVEVVHGRWEPHKKLPGYLECSNCHDCMVYDSWVDGKKWGYCPNCGAKMDGGANNG